VAVERVERLPVRTAEDLVRARQAVRAATVALGFSLVDQTKIVTAASELARNTILHGGGGDLTVESLRDGPRSGVRLTFVDQGPGIANIEQALRDGYTTGTGLGLGLGGARRLMSDLSISSRPAVGTTIVAVRWRQ
jgi:serine/threonine-protein kinase RsbT